MRNWTIWEVILLATQAMPVPPREHSLDDAIRCASVDTGAASLDACSRIIANADGSESSTDLALAYGNRGLTFANMENYEKALSDGTAAY